MQYVLIRHRISWEWCQSEFMNKIEMLFKDKIVRTHQINQRYCSRILRNLLKLRPNSFSSCLALWLRKSWTQLTKESPHRRSSLVKPNKLDTVAQYLLETIIKTWSILGLLLQHKIYSYTKQDWICVQIHQQRKKTKNQKILQHAEAHNIVSRTAQSPKQHLWPKSLSARLKK